jgi:bifunctional non-homologous end joining protein LigD
MAKPLAEYNAKRDFKKTPEPMGRPGKGEGFSFCIQKHDATRLHYDFRLELDGVLKSWAVTKGPSLVPGEKRLAVHTEDHPLDYGSFEGTIPKGEYGGGTVLLWDRGHWEPEGDPYKGLEKGNLKFRLRGEKLDGAWHLVRMRQRPRERQEGWLLIKSDDAAARSPDEPDILEEMPRSVKTGRTLDEIADDAKSAVWRSNRNPDESKAKAKRTPASKAGSGKMAKGKPAQEQVRAARGGTAGTAKAKPARTQTRATGASAIKTTKRGAAGKKAPMPREIEPCLALLVEDVPKGEPWLHEIKWDGYRLLAFIKDGKVQLRTRKGLDWTDRFPGIAKALAGLPVETAIVDGEAIVEDEKGLSSFSALQQALSERQAADGAIFYAFDILYLDGDDLRALPLGARKERLIELVPPGGGGALRLSEHIDANGEAMMRSACQLGLEGVISKKRDAPYRSGRGGDWLKIKCSLRQEFVISGFTPSSALPRAVGSLVLGYYDNGGLKHAGRTGTGFTATTARDVWKRLQPLKTGKPPFADPLNTLQKRDAVWVKPELVAEVEFRGWTHDLHVRHAAFKGLREDKDPREVVREAANGEAPKQERARPETRARERRQTNASGEVVFGGVPLTHPDRILWEDKGLTKQGLAEFYDEIADWILPHVIYRPLALVRCPSGVEKGCFFQKHSWAGLSDFIRRDTVRDEQGEEEVLFVENVSGVIALVQAGVLEIHPWGARIGDVDRPDRIVMDLDPGEGVAWPQVIEAAREVRERLRAVGLASFVKTTGGKGLHVVLPLTPGAGWDEVKAFARSLSESMEADHPQRYISTAAKKARRGLIYVDYLRNGRGATAIAAYSTRARPGAPVAVPLAWDELSSALKPNQFTVENLPARLQRLRKDPWAELFKIKQRLPSPPAKKKTTRARTKR